MRHFMKLAALLIAAITLAAPALSMAEETPNITAHKADGIVIDGSLEDWNLDSAAVLDQPEQVVRDASYWQGVNDCSVKYYLAWDETNLYMAADVTEDSPLGAIDMLPIDGEDNLKLYICTDPAADPARTAYGTNDFLVYLIMDEGYWDTAIDRNSVSKELKQRFVSKGMDGGESVIDGYECAVVMTTTGFLFECVIPWATFSNESIPVYAPAAGDTLAVNFAITDISYPCPGTEYIPQLVWTGTNAINSDPSQWGSVTLAD